MFPYCCLLITSSSFYVQFSRCIFVEINFALSQSSLTLPRCSLRSKAPLFLLSKFQTLRWFEIWVCREANKMQAASQFYILSLFELNGTMWTRFLLRLCSASLRVIARLIVASTLSFGGPKWTRTTDLTIISRVL